MCAVADWVATGRGKRGLHVSGLLNAACQAGTDQKAHLSLSASGEKATPFTVKESARALQRVKWVGGALGGPRVADFAENGTHFPPKCGHVLLFCPSFSLREGGWY
jgi:hypothetical protein